MMLSMMLAIQLTRGRRMSAQTTIRLGMTTLTVVPQEERLVDGEPAAFASLEVRPELGSVEAEVIDIGDVALAQVPTGEALTTAGFISSALVPRRAGAG
jgi:hypothetical protein